jgi:hypothetical protein
VSAAAFAALLVLIEEAIKAEPAVVADVEALISRLKAPKGAPLAPQVATDTESLAKQLGETD